MYGIQKENLFPNTLKLSGFWFNVDETYFQAKKSCSSIWIGYSTKITIQENKLQVNIEQNEYSMEFYQIDHN